MQFGNLGKPEWVQGVGSLLAVAVALGLAIEQRLSSNRGRIEDLAREHRADRARLTFALSELRAYANACIRLSASLMRKRDSHDVITFDLDDNLPKMKKGSVRDISKCISSAPSSEVARALGSVIEFAQVQSSRLRSLKADGRSSLTPFEAAGYLFDASDLGIRVDTLFPYARFEAEDIVSISQTKALEVAARMECVDREDSTFKEFFFLVDNLETRVKTPKQHPVVSSR